MLNDEIDGIHNRGLLVAVALQLIAHQMTDLVKDRRFARLIALIILSATQVLPKQAHRDQIVISTVSIVAWRGMGRRSLPSSPHRCPTLKIFVMTDPNGPLDPRRRLVAHG